MHIALGIFYRLWCLLESDCHKLDLEVATHDSSSPTDRESFKLYSSLVKKLALLKEEKHNLVQLTSTLNSVLGDLAVQFVDSHPLVLALKQQVQSTALQLDGVVHNTITVYPCRLHACIPYQSTGETNLICGEDL